MRKKNSFKFLIQLVELVFVNIIWHEIQSFLVLLDGFRLTFRAFVRSPVVVQLPALRAVVVNRGVKLFYDHVGVILVKAFPKLSQGQIDGV